MSLVHKVKDIKVTKKSNNLYLIESEIEFDKSFIYKNLIPSEMIQSENKSLLLKANKVESLEQYLKSKPENRMEYSNANLLLKDLIKVKDNLTKYNLMFVNIDIADFIVINDNIFVYINYNNIYTLTADNYINIEMILEPSKLNKKGEYKQDTVPFSLDIKSLYYNIANLIFYCLFGKIYDGNKMSIHPIYYTKIYWFLERCLEGDINDRVFLFV